MNSLEIIPLPAYADNYIWLLRAGDAVAAVDPGDAMPVLDYLDRTQTRLCALLITHHHGDHTGGIERLTALHDVPVYGPARENIIGVDHPVQGGEHFTLAALDAEFEALDVAGHTRGHVAYYGSTRLFCGDTLFGAGCGRLFEGTPQQMHASLTRLAGLPMDTAIHCAHEYTEANLRFAATVEPDNPDIAVRVAATRRMRERDLPSLPSTLALERATNPFLRCDVAAVVAAAERRLERPTTGATDVFAALREWRNAF